MHGIINNPLSISGDLFATMLKKISFCISHIYYEILQKFEVQAYPMLPIKACRLGKIQLQEILRECIKWQKQIILDCNMPPWRK